MTDTSSEPRSSADSPNGARLSTNVRLLGLISLINDIAGEMIFPLVPSFLRNVLHAGPEALGLVEGVADSTASVLKLYSGTLSDRLGKRKVFILAGYLLAALARPLTGLATLAWQVLAVRFADRFGKGIRAAARDALVADSTPREARGRAVGYTRAMDHLGAVIGPLLAFGYLSLWPHGYRTLFLLTAVPGLIVVLVVYFGLRERPIVTAASKEFRFSLAPFAAPFRWFLLALVVFTLGNSSDAFLLWRLEELGVASESIPLVWGAFHVVKSAGSLLAGRAVDRMGPLGLILGGWVIYAVIYLAFAFATSAWAGWTFMLIYGAFHALTEPAERTLVANLVPADRQGLAFGWFNFAIGIAALPASLLFGSIYALAGATAAFVWSASLAILATGLLAATVRVSPRLPPA